MEKKFTPGPWHVEGGQNETGESTNVLLAGNKVLCTDIFEYENAVLIAAAPALLEALKTIQELNSTWNGGVSVSIANICEQAIKSATS